MNHDECDTSVITHPSLSTVTTSDVTTVVINSSESGQTIPSVPCPLSPSDSPSGIGLEIGSSISQVHIQETQPRNPTTNVNSSFPSSLGINEDTDVALSPDASLQQEGIKALVNIDIIMWDSASSTSLPSAQLNDKDLPTWLAPIIGYLRSASDEASWQDLVTEFIDFEKCGPPYGVSSRIFFLLQTLTNQTCIA